MRNFKTRATVQRQTRSLQMPRLAFGQQRTGFMRTLWLRQREAAQKVRAVSPTDSTVVTPQRFRDRLFEQPAWAAQVVKHQSKQTRQRNSMRT